MLGSGSGSSSGWKVGYRFASNKNQNTNPHPDPHQGDKSNPDPHQRDADLQHWIGRKAERVTDPHHFALHRIDANLRSLVHRPSRTPLWDFPTVHGSPRLHLETLKLLNFDFKADRIMLFTPMRIRIQLTRIMWIRIRKPGERTELVQHSAWRGSSQRRNIATRTGHTNDMLWLYRSPVWRRRSFSQSHQECRLPL